MLFKKTNILTSFIVVFFIGSAAFASGGGDNDDSSGFGSESSFDSEVPERVVDQHFESGKAIYTGRSKTAIKLSYCLGMGNLAVKIKRKNIKRFKNSSFSELAKNLYRCDSPNKTIKNHLERQEFLLVLYYLDKRYKLKLARS